LIQRKLKTPEQKARIGKSACDQCRFCTELCPRYLLGYAVEPHQVMRSLAFTATGEAHWNAFGALCCACGLCTLFSCPEQLFPKEACDNSKVQMRKAGIKYSGPSTAREHPMLEGRRTPIGLLARKLAVTEYDVEIPFREQPLETMNVVLPLRQGAGVPNQPRVKTGDLVVAGQTLGEIPQGQLGARIHAPFPARVTAVSEQSITLTKTT
jgi:Na+-translocating ferredoxin:NAD+ oxidoreductase RnfC subunit